jgi:hypothetical protein
LNKKELEQELNNFKQQTQQQTQYLYQQYKIELQNVKNFADEV